MDKGARVESESKHSTLIPLSIVLVIGLVAMYLGILPKGMVGAMCLLLPLALIIERFGNWLPGWRTFMGGAPLILIFTGAGLVYFNLIPDYAREIFSTFMRSYDKNLGSYGVSFLDFYICGLIVGAILGINSKLLLKAGVRYIVPMTACIFTCSLLCACIAGIMGFGWKNGISMIAFPILGGGMGGGVVPMTQVISEGISEEVGKQMISAFVPALALGNIFAIMAAGLLHWLGTKFPQLSGNGQIMKNSDIENVLPTERLTTNNIIIGLAVSTGFFALGVILKFLLKKLGGMVGVDVNIHHLALTIIAVFTCKVTNIIPEYVITACYTWFRFIVKAFTAVILLGIGIVYTDLGTVIAAITPTYVVLCLTVVIASILGAGLGGKLVGFNIIESAITAGLCMANMGGTGDVAVLSASKRMNLMPFARFSTSIGGGFVIILCSIFVKFLYGS